MNNANKKIFFFPLPQEIIVTNDESKLFCNIVVMPKFNPLNPLTVVTAPFASSDIRLDAFMVKGTEALPSLINHNDTYAKAQPQLDIVSPDRIDIFTQLSTFFQIDDTHGRGNITAVPIKKYLPDAYRNAFGFAGTRQGSVMDDSYFCALKENKFASPPNPIGRDNVNWSQVMAFCLHQPELARQLGLLYKTVEIKLPSADYYANGGWLYVDLNEQSSYHDLLPEDVQRYAAWIPAVTQTRTLFSPVLFPVEEAPAIITLDDVFDEVVRYSDGYAKIVHASQPVTTDHLSEVPDGTAPSSDMGIRLGWDDEQVLEWFNRGFQSQEKIQKPAGATDTPLMVSRYRVDVAKVEGDDIFLESGQLEKKLSENNLWKSQVSKTADEVKAGTINLGSVSDESGVQVSPAKHGDTGSFWLPAYFANWNGTSMCLPDPLPEKINQLEDIKKEMLKNEGNNKKLPEVLYRQPAGDKVELKYGSAYAFRVRLSDISGGGPGSGSTSLNRGEHKIAIQKFKRYVAPQPPAVTLAVDQQSIIIERPRLNYPAILFTGIKNSDATTELLADRQKLIQARSEHENNPNRKWLREVSLPDPDVLQVEIVVEIRSLDMDREGSYHAMKKISPKEPFVFLYKTFRRFPAYELKHDRPDDVINLVLAYEDRSIIKFSAPADDLGFAGEIHSDRGPLVLPTGRDLRLTMRSFCPDDKIEYFGTEESRISIPYVLSVRQDPVKLEDEALFTEPTEQTDPILSLFFQPEKAITAQSRQEQRFSGKGNETEMDLLDRLASLARLINRNGTFTGQDNVRTQFGCSALINHSLAPDSTSVYFSSRNDFYNKWINVIQLELARDWTWDLLKPDSFIVFRQWRFEGEEVFRLKENVGKISLSKGLNWQAMNGPDRSFTRLIFIDTLDPKPSPGEFPEPVELQYFIQPNFKQSKRDGVFADLQFDEALTTKTLFNLLPITTVPAQVPKIVSVGIALSPDITDEALIANRYNETASRNRYLWIEFDAPIADAKDNYFARVLAYAPDPMLAALPTLLNDVRLHNNELLGNPTWNETWKNFLLTEQTEPPLNLDPEKVRVIRHRQPFDQAGLDAMQPMTPANTKMGEKASHFLLPLPDGVYPDSEELFGFFTYEFRVGHQHPKKWCTAQGRYGSPLRLTGVQHPAPPMLLSTIRDRDKVVVTSRHAQSFFNGNNVTPAVPRTDIYACLYAQVLQADGVHYRNLLIDRIALLKPLFSNDPEKRAAYEKQKAIQEDTSKPFTPPEAPVLMPGIAPRAIGFWNLKTIREKLRFLGISDNASLSVLTIELMPPNDFHNNEMLNANLQQKPSPPQDLSLDRIRILRTSKLCPVKDSCAVES